MVFVSANPKMDDNWGYLGSYLPLCFFLAHCLVPVDWESDEELACVQGFDDLTLRLRTPGRMFGWTRAPWFFFQILAVSVSVSAGKTWKSLRFLGCFPLQPCIIPDVDTCSLAQKCHQSNKSVVRVPSSENVQQCSELTPQNGPFQLAKRGLY